MRVRAGLAGVVVALSLLTSCQSTSDDQPGAKAQPSTAATPTKTASKAPSTVPSTGRNQPPVRHVFVVNLENKSFETTFGAGSPAPYLARTLPSQGAFLTEFYGIAHFSLPNYLAQVSGQGPNRDTQADCGRFSRFALTGWADPQQAVGSGCVYPPAVKTIANQLDAKGLTWRGYMEDMGSPCRHPVLGESDTSHDAKVGDQYATRHNPFVYFQAISESTCRADVVDLGRLRHDLRTRSTTRSLSYITPNLCDDGHDSPCVDGRPGGLASADVWLRTWVPRITSSPAFKADGMLVVTFDEADPKKPGGSAACCGQTSSPNTDQAGLQGPGGGRIGAVVLSPFVRPGTRSGTPYNQYSLLRTMESVFHLPSLGYAATVNAFGDDVWTAR